MAEQAKTQRTGNKNRTLIRGLKTGDILVTSGSAVAGAGATLLLSSFHLLPSVDEGEAPVVTAAAEEEEEEEVVIEEVPEDVNTQPECNHAIVVPSERVHDADLDAESFADAFVRAREAAGPGHVFIWQGNAYTTDTVEEIRELPVVEREELVNEVVFEAVEEEIVQNEEVEVLTLSGFDDTGSEDLEEVIPTTEEIIEQEMAATMEYLDEVDLTEEEREAVVEELEEVLREEVEEGELNSYTSVEEISDFNNEESTSY